MEKSTIFLILYLYFVSAKHHLVHVNTLFRHGDRSPISTFIFDGYDPFNLWTEGLGQLTQEGIEQQYLLGKWFKDRYHYFNPSNYNASIFRMRSSDVDRSLMSAQAFQAGVYHKSHSVLNKYSLSWRPISVHTVSRTWDDLFSLAPCPRMDQRLKELYASPEMTGFLKKHETTLKLIATEYGFKNLTVININEIHDDLLCLKAHNFTLPTWYTNEIAEELNTIADYIFDKTFTDTEIHKIVSGVYIKHNFNRMESFIKHNSSLESILAYAAHDTNVASLLAAFGAYAGESMPRYAAIVMLELVGPLPPANTSDFTLRLFYKRGWTDTLGEYLQFAACRNSGRNASDGCPFNVVYKSVVDIMLDHEQRTEACKVAWIPTTYKILCAGLLAGFLIIFFTSISAVYFVQRRNKNEVNGLPYTRIGSDSVLT